MTDISNGIMERLTIYVSGTPYFPEGKLVNITAIPSDSGEIIANELI